MAELFIGIAGQTYEVNGRSYTTDRRGVVNVGEPGDEKALRSRGFTDPPGFVPVQPGRPTPPAVPGTGSGGGTPPADPNAPAVFRLVPYAPNDASAAELGIPIGGVYRNMAGLQQRQV